MMKHSAKSFKRILALTLTPFMFSTFMPWSQALTASADETMPTIVKTFEEFTNALTKGGSIELGYNITFESEVTVEQNVVIDFAGYGLEYTGNSQFAMTLNEAEVTFNDSSKDRSGVFLSKNNGLLYFRW